MILLPKNIIKTLVVFFVAVGFLVAAVPALADTCIGCHTNPKYEKKDADRLAECLQCHGDAGHPLKDKAGKTLPREAVKKGSIEIAKHPQIKKTFKARKLVASDYKEMIFIPSGEFLMGSDDRLRDEKPALISYVDGFYIDVYEVTNKDYKEFIDVAEREVVPTHWDKGKDKRQYPREKSNHPVVFVSWHDADDYCRWRGKRLPRETEWEKAARGADGRVYPWGNVWDLEKSNNPLKGIEDTLPIGSFEAGKSPYGLYDMSGNVWEWVNDKYLPHAGSDYVSPEFGNKYKILKGGSWWDCMFYGCGISAPTYNRSFFDANTRNDSFGFRCAADKPRGFEKK
jgi:formylglycine-generating enzyme required for sulfatase activity